MSKVFEFETEEKTYKLVLDLNAQCLFEDLTDKGFYEVAANKEYMATAKENRAMLYAMLKRYQPDITLEEAGALVTTLADIPAIRAAMLRSQPEGEGEGESGPPPEPTG